MKLDLAPFRDEVVVFRERNAAALRRVLQLGNQLRAHLHELGHFGVERRPLTSGQLAVFGSGDSIELTGDSDAQSPALEVLLLGGRPIKEPVAADGPVVLKTRAQLKEAFEEKQAGRLGTIPAAPHPGHLS